MGLQYNIPDDSAPVRVVPTDIDTIQSTMAGQLLPTSQATYLRDFGTFQKWLENHNLNLADVTYQDVTQYRNDLRTAYRPATAQRMLTVVRRVYKEALRLKMVEENPAEGVDGFSVSDSSPRTALTLQQCKTLIEAIDCSTPRGKRDYALLTLMIQTGIRRASVVSLRVEDLKTNQGHYIAVLEHAKGDHRQEVKIPVPVHRAIEAYLVERGDITPHDFVFVAINKSGKWSTTPIHPYGGLNYILSERAQTLGIHLTPHDLRATFATLALESAPLVKVQDAMHHKDPKTTQRYNRRRHNLDDNAVDYIKLISE